MRITNVSYVVGILFLAVVCIASAASLPPSVLDSTWQDSIDYLLTRGTLTGIRRSSRPYPREAVSAALRRASRRELSPFEGRLVARLQEEWSGKPRDFHAAAAAGLRLQPEYDPRVLPVMNAAFRYELPLLWTFYQEFEIAPISGRDESLPGATTAANRVRTWDPFGVFPQKGYFADFSRAYVQGNLMGVRLMFGREIRRWGRGLLLSDASPALDGFSFEGTYGKVQGIALFAALNTMWHDDGTKRYLARRYFAAHRLDWKPSERLEIGVMDSVLYGGDGRLMEWYYLNPLIPFYASQYNASFKSNPEFLDDNAAIAFDFLWTPINGWTVYGDLFVDDFAYDPESNDPQDLAWTAGIHQAGWLERGEVRMEYTRVGRYVYTHLVPEQQYTYFGASLGYPLGNDADALEASAAWWLTPKARIAATLRQTRKGDSGVDDRFRGETDTSFLKGAEEIRRSVSLGGWARFGGWRVHGETSVIRQIHPDHREGESRTLLEWRGMIAREFGTR